MSPTPVGPDCRSHIRIRSNCTTFPTIARLLLDYDDEKLAPALVAATTDELIHKFGWKSARIPARHRVHHRDVVRVALDRLERDLRGQSDVMLDFYKLEHKSESTKAANH